MQTILYYFTGTGNSLSVARAIARELGDTEVVPMAAVPGYATVPADAGRAGFVFPVYMWGLPLIVARFLRGFSGRPEAYLFAVATYGGSPGNALVHASNILAKNGQSLSAGFGVAMPGNYVPMYAAFSEKKQQMLFSKEACTAHAIAEAVRAGVRQKPETGNFMINGILSRFFYPFVAPKIPTMDRRFWADKKCNGCGVCARVCPVRNIVLENGRPRWLGHCEQCMACLQWCPREALQSGGNTPGRKRYRHPGVRLEDMLRGESADGL